MNQVTYKSLNKFHTAGPAQHLQETNVMNHSLQALEQIPPCRTCTKPARDPMSWTTLHLPSDLRQLLHEHITVFVRQ